MTEERRYHAAPAEIQTAKGQPFVVGYAAIFGSPSKMLTFRDGKKFREIVEPGAFLRSLMARNDVLARYEHSEILGRVSNGTLRLSEDARGLRYEITPPNTQAGRDVIELIRRRDVPFASFAFTVPSGGDAWRSVDGILTRTLRNVDLIDIAPVAQPAYGDTYTEIALRSYRSSQLARR